MSAAWGPTSDDYFKIAPKSSAALHAGSTNAGVHDCLRENQTYTSVGKDLMRGKSERDWLNDFQQGAMTKEQVRKPCSSVQASITCSSARRSANT
jgi:hypothetical protein